MLLRPRALVRQGVTVVECAFILPFTFFLLLALAVGAMGIMRYQEVATLSREGARYASTHGYQYRQDAGLSIGTTEDWIADIKTNAILNSLVSIDASDLQVDITWPNVINQANKPDNWPGSKVDVKVTYKWLPELYLVGPIYMTSTSSMPITN